jgi:hypothetical protein
MGRLSVESFFQWMRGGIATALVLLMAAVSSGVLGDPAWASVARPYIGVRQADNDDNSPPIVLNVNSTLDEIDANPGDGVCASAANRCTLRAAVMEANVRGGRHTVNLPTGTYRITIPGAVPDNNDPTTPNAEIGDFDIRADITIVGSGAANTVVDGNGLDRVFQVDSGREADLRSMTIRGGNVAGSGGGISSRGSLRLHSVIVTNNTSTDEGGGIDANDVALFSSTVSTNRSNSNGGGIAASHAELDGSVVSGNRSGDRGGGISASFVELENSTVSGNQADQSGGGLEVSGSIRMVGSTVNGNAAPIGAGVHATENLDVSNSTISGNTATGNGSTTGLGGGLFFDGRPDSGSLLNVTIAGNTAPRGSGIYKGAGDLSAKNTVVATNTGSSDCFRAGPIISLGNNVDGGTGCGFISSGDRQNTNPNLGSLADNGGPTRTHALNAGSPAIDGGSNTGCPSTDQRGIQRPRDGDSNGTALCDIGAFEAPGTLGTLPLDNQDDDDNVSRPEPDNHASPDNDEGAPTPPGQTSLSGLACPGVTRLSVFQTTGFSPGDTVRINPGGSTQEDARVADVGCGGRFIHLTGPLQYRHSVSETVVVTAPAASNSTNPVTQSSNDRDREQSKPKTEEQRQQAEQTNRSGRDDLHTEGDVLAVNLTKQPPEIIIGTRDGRQTIQLHCGSQCPTISVGDYVEVDGTKENEGLFYADDVTVTRR